MTTVFVVLSNDEHDYDYRTVCSTRDKAIAIAKGLRTGGYSESYSVVETVLDSCEYGRRTWDANLIVTCPHCGKETTFYFPRYIYHKNRPQNCPLCNNLFTVEKEPSGWVASVVVEKLEPQLPREK